MNIYLLIVLLIIYYAVLPVLFAIFIKSDKALKITFLVYLIAFLPLLICGVFGVVNISNNVTVTFASNGKWLGKAFSFSPVPRGVQDFVINVFMLVPIGISTYVLAKNQKLLKGLLVGVLVGAIIEIMQLILPITRSPELSDIILNSISSLLGAVYMLVIYKIKDKLFKAKLNTNTQGKSNIKNNNSDDNSIGSENANNEVVESSDRVAKNKAKEKVRK